MSDRERIARLARRARWNVASGGLASGVGRGRRLGIAGEFEGYRPYESGSDLRALDLRVYRRLRQRVVRVSREDSVTPVTLLIDRSASMLGVAREGAARPVIGARELAVRLLNAFFLTLARRRGDPVRLFLYRDGALERVPIDPSEDPLNLMERVLDGAPPAGTTQAERVFRQLPPHPSGRGVTLVSTDGWDLGSAARTALPLARDARPHYVIPLEAEERELPRAESARVLFREEDGAWRGHWGPREQRLYRERLHRYHSAFEHALLRLGGSATVIPAERPLEEQLARLSSGSGPLR